MKLQFYVLSGNKLINDIGFLALIVTDSSLIAMSFEVTQLVNFLSHIKNPLALMIFHFFTNFSFDPGPTIRSTFWTFTVGGVFTYLYSWSVSQLSVQRFLATKSLKEAQK